MKTQAKYKHAVWLLLALAAALFTVGGFGMEASGPAQAEPGHQSLLRVPAGVGRPITRKVTLGLSKSMVIEFPRDVRDILVSDPKKVDAVVSTARRAYLIGMEVGQANAFFFDENGEQMLTIEIRVERDLDAVSQMLHKLMPDSDIQLEAVNDNIILTGYVANPADATRASDLASRLVGDKEKVLNMLTVEAREQVALKVTIVEMERNIIKQLGINIDAVTSTGNFTLGALTNFQFPLSAQQTLGTVARKSLNFADGSGNSVNGVMRALERDGLSRTLAEPTLTAISGETANFLAGGEFPIPVAQDSDTISIEFKPFGVGLAFTPTVMSEGLISLKISTEVSELSNEGAITLSAITIPALKVRRATSTVELPSGGSLMMAGLISNQTRQSIEGYPGLKNLPILGALFRSRDFIKSETELVVIVTPYTVDPAPRKKLVRPDRGFAESSDIGADLLGHLNKVYGRKRGAKPDCCYQGDFGFIIE